ncbi:MAG TPA: hypothetical protein VGB76_15560 [Pyrinomonadaceae bacterium]|jgi:hypothetical protein
MLKLKWPRRTKTGETEAGAPGDATAAAGVDEATITGGATRALDEVRLRNSLEVIKTAVVWLVVINILTVLSPLLWLSLKWTLVVGVLLTAGSLSVGCVAYLRALRTQRQLPE